MKKLVIFLCLSLILLSLVSAAESPIDINQIEEGADRIETSVGDVEDVIDDPKSILGKTKAEERIDAINKWLTDNASWLKVVFGMVPEISWLFAINLYFWMLFLVILFLNGNTTFSLLTKNKGRILGGVLFVVLLVLKLYFNIAKVLVRFVDVIWNVILPYGFLVALVIAIAIILLLLYSLYFAPGILAAIGKWFEARREAREKEEEKDNRKALDVTVKEMTKK